MCHVVLRMHFDRPPFQAVIKLNSDPDHEGYVQEKLRLDYLRENTGLPCPRVYLQDGSRARIPYSYLLLEVLPGVNLASAHLTHSDRVSMDRELAEALLELHAHTRDTFGRIDEDPGPSRWTEIVVPRLQDMRGEMEDKLPRHVLSDVDCALEAAEEVMRPQGRPTLIHGDVWAGNVMVAQKDNRWHLSGFLDPGLQFADVEHELAYLQVFDTVTSAFFEAYTSRTPLRPGYTFRRLFYWLNTYMTHVWLFGDGRYRDGVASVAAEIAGKLRPRVK